MKRIEIRLNLKAVAPLVDVIRSLSGDLGSRLSVPPVFPESDHDLQHAWETELLGEQSEECRFFLGLFDREFIDDGLITFNEEEAMRVLRACSAIRLRLREAKLARLSDDVLEGSAPDPKRLPAAERKAYACYLFLAALQEVIIDNLD